MRSKVVLTVLLSCLLFTGTRLLAQSDSTIRKHKVVVFTPLYLDTVFDKGTGDYKFGMQFPHFIDPGLEFYEGVQLALDSLAHEKVPLEVVVFDTHSSTKTLEQQINAPEAAGAGLYLGYVTPAEERIIAAAALKRTIPFINANLPNDAGISNNPSLVILNSTLKTHCEGIYHFIQRYYPITQAVVFRKKGGVLEDRLKGYLVDYEKNTNGAKVNMKYVTLEDNDQLDLRPYLDSERLTISIVGSLDENFGKKIAQQLALLNPTHPALVIGMPTWDGIDFNKKEYSGLDIVYSTPFYTDKANALATAISDTFNATMFARPGDMLYRGYECMYRFGKLLVEKDSNLVSSIGEKKYKVFNDFDIQPVLNRQTLSLEYFENKKLYFIKKADGVIKQVY